MLEHSLIIALLVLAIWYSMQEGEIFGFMQRFSHWKIAPALFECNVCMSPWWGSAIYWLFPWHKLGFGESLLIEWPIVVVCAMGINAGLNKLSPDKETPVLTERDIVNKMDNMCKESCSPDQYWQWSQLKAYLGVTRKKLKDDGK